MIVLAVRGIRATCNRRDTIDRYLVFPEAEVPLRLLPHVQMQQLMS